MRKLAIVIFYLISIGYVVLIVTPALYCIQNTCSGPDLDGFMPAFAFTPFGGIATIFSLRHATREIRRGGSWSWAFWFLTIVFVIVLAGIAALVAIGIYMTAIHR